MKHKLKIFLIVVLFNQNLLAEDIFYCSSEFAAGVIKENGKWIAVDNFQLDRFTIKFGDDYKILKLKQNQDDSEEEFFCSKPFEDLLDSKDKEAYDYDALNTSSCLSEFSALFIFNPITKKFSYHNASLGSYTSKSVDDTTVTYYGDCNDF